MGNREAEYLPTLPKITQEIFSEVEAKHRSCSPYWKTTKPPLSPYLNAVVNKAPYTKFSCHELVDVDETASSYSSAVKGYFSRERRG